MDDELIPLAYNWLTSHPNHGSWLDVWEKLRDLYPGDERVTALAARAEAWEMLERASIESGVVEGIIAEKIEGGFLVNIANVGVTGFLPGSHVDIRPARNLDKFVGMRSRFAVLKYNRKRGNVVVSRRDLLEKEKESSKRELLKVLEEGVVLEGTVKNVTGYGAFVDLGGMDGILHISDMSWGRITHPSEVVKVGDRIKVQVLKFDPARERISLGMKQITPDPWSFVGTKYLVGSRVEGRVVKLVDFGAFVELEPGVDGLIHVSEMTWVKKTPHPSEVFHVGQTVHPEILNMDLTKRRIALGWKQIMPNPWDVAGKKYAVGSCVRGRVANILDYATFVELEPGVEGLIHISEMSWTQPIKHPSDMVAIGEEIDARVISVDSSRQRLTLSIKQLENWIQPDPWNSVVDRYPLGSRARGLIKIVTDFGIFIELQPGLTGYVPASEISTHEPSGDLADIIAAGEEVDVLVLDIDPSRRHLRLSLKEVSDTI